MRVVFVGNKERKTKPEDIVFGRNALVLLGSGYLPKISLDDELRGESNYIKSLCILSQNFNLTFLAAAPLICRKKHFFGTIIVDCGKLLGISDMTHPLKTDFDESNTLRVFETSLGRLGVVSGDDINYFEVSRLMKLWECDGLFFGINGKLNRKNKILAEAQGYMNETTAIIFGSDGARAYNCHSFQKINAFSFSLVLRSDSLLIEHRRRELYRDLVIR